MDTPALVLSGQVNALGVIRGLGEERVPVYLFQYSNNDMAQASKHVLQSFRTRDPMADEQAFVGDLLERGPRFRGALLVPTSDEALAAASRFKAQLDEHFVVGCPEWDIAKACLDKALTARLAEDRDLPAPRSLVPHALDEAVNASGSLGFPLLVKPAQSHLYYRAFGRKLTQVRDREDLEQRYPGSTDRPS